VICDQVAGMSYVICGYLDEQVVEVPARVEGSHPRARLDSGHAGPPGGKAAMPPPVSRRGSPGTDTIATARATVLPTTCTPE